MPGVLLGSIQFVDREIPDIINFGGQQKLAIHNQIGGTRVIDAMGPEPIPIAWSGLFFGTNASNRARQVDALRESGEQVPLSWGTFRYLVVVADFKAEYKNEWEVRYRIRCEVVSNLNSSAPISLTSIFVTDFANLMSIINGFTSSVSSILSPAALANINGALTTIADTISSDTSIPVALTGIVNNALGTISDVTSQNQALSSTDIGSVNDALGQISDAVVGNSFVPAGSITAISDAVNTIGSAVSLNTFVPTDVASAVTDAQTAFNDAAAATEGGSILDVSLSQLQPVVKSANTALETLDNAIGSPTNGIDLRASTETSVLDGINAFATEANKRSGESDLRTMHAYLGRITSNLEMLGG